LKDQNNGGLGNRSFLETRAFFTPGSEKIT